MDMPPFNDDHDATMAMFNAGSEYETKDNPDVVNDVS